MWFNKQDDLKWLDVYMKEDFERFPPNYMLIYKYEHGPNTFHIKFGIDFEKENTKFIRYRIVKITPEISKMLVDRNYNFIDKEVKLFANDIRK